MLHALLILSSYAVILGGGKTEADANAYVERFNEQGKPAFQKLNGYPRVYASADIEGLNAGFQIAVLGFCDSKAAAGRARDVSNVALGGGAYTKAVKGDFKNACPKLITVPAVGDAGEQRHAGTFGSRVHWMVRGPDPDHNDTIVVKAGTRTVAAESYEEVTPMTIGERQFFVVEADAGHVDDYGRGWAEWLLVGYVCGQLKSVLHLGSAPGGYGGGPSEIKVSKDGGWQSITTGVDRGKTHHTWKGCTYVETKPAPSVDP